MNTEKTCLPQDGRLTVTFDGRSFDYSGFHDTCRRIVKVVLRFLQRFDLVPYSRSSSGRCSELLARYQRALK